MKFQTNYPDPGVTPLDSEANMAIRHWEINTLEDLKNPQPLSEITMWFRLESDGTWTYNHYNDGYTPGLKVPPPLVPEHEKMWKNGKWGYARAVMKNRVILFHDGIIPCQ